ncbi:MAG: HAMP domain-containing protein, partial [Solirubrobacterales bacterium]|nr:HAMP domain-containing protein [Solirubrobacterales bacterium]
MRIGPVSLRLPAPTIRLRMTALYGLMFLVMGAVLLTIGYELARHNVNGHYRDEAARILGFRPDARGFDFGPYFRAIRAQLQADALHRLLIEYVFALGAMTIVAVVAGWLLAGRALRPLRQITATARRVSGENLGERIALTGPADELKELA